jgi:pseudouridine kinase
MGSRGVFCFDGKQCFELPSKPVIVVNTTGAGDAFMAGVVHAELHGATMQEACAIGIEAATLSLQSATAVNPEINRLTIS